MNGLGKIKRDNLLASANQNKKLFALVHWNGSRPVYNVRGELVLEDIREPLNLPQTSRYNIRVLPNGSLQLTPEAAVTADHSIAAKDCNINIPASPVANSVIERLAGDAPVFN